MIPLWGTAAEQLPVETQLLLLELEVRAAGILPAAAAAAAAVVPRLLCSCAAPSFASMPRWAPACFCTPCCTTSQPARQPTPPSLRPGLLTHAVCGARPPADPPTHLLPLLPLPMPPLQASSHPYCLLSLKANGKFESMDSGDQAPLNVSNPAVACQACLPACRHAQPASPPACLVLPLAWSLVLTAPCLPPPLLTVWRAGAVCQQRD